MAKNTGFGTFGARAKIFEFAKHNSLEFAHLVDKLKDIQIVDQTTSQIAEIFFQQGRLP